MDLKNLINDDERGQGKKEAQSTSATAPAPAPQYTNDAQPSTPSHYGRMSQQQTPLYPPPSAGSIAARPPPSQGMTPLRTSSQNIQSAQYPFPQPTQQSPISAAPGQHYRPFESQPATTPARPGSHGHPYQTSQPASYSSQTPIQQQHSYTSISPTPPSHLSRTPSSMRQSPLTTMSHLPSQQHPQQYSQPNTPLGPPQHYPQRAPTYPETQSPYHQRSFSNASNGLISGSPAQHHPGIPNLVESPSAYARPSPQHSHARRPSEYLTQSQRGSRERSISVSPKTKPPPRPPSLGSRHSSNPQEIYSARSSEQYNNAPLAGSPNHVMQPIPQPQSQSQPRFAPYPNAASEVPQATPTSLQSTPTRFSPAAQSSLSSQPGNQVPQPPPTNISHQSEKMGMSHLVTPASDVPLRANGNSTSQSSAAAKPKDGVNIFMKKEKSATPKNRTPYAPPLSQLQSQGSHVEAANTSIKEEQMADAGSNGAVPAANTEVEMKASLKRPASSSNSLEEPPSKQLKPTTSRKHSARPIWARLSRHNPKYDQQGPVNGAPNGRPPPSRVNGGGPVKSGPVMSQSSESSGSEPIDTDMIRMRSFLGDWERSYKNSEPLSDTKRSVAHWMFTELSNLRDVGTDPHYGTVEIEGKIGTLFHKDTGDRCSLPVMNTVVLNKQLSEQYRFESRMQEFEHAHMNGVLNEALRKSHSQPNRVKMDYHHFTDTDSFKPLSPAGNAALPPSIRTRVEHGRPPRLRTTVRQEKGRSPYVAARIVKVNVANLHIYSPNDPYDLRISINVEVNLDRPDLHPDDLVADPNPKEQEKEKESMLDRKKDRISYAHLAYQVDLTRVDVGIEGQKKRPLFELEIEVDVTVLRRQMELSERGEDSAFGDVVSGFWDDAVLLMRERVSVQR